MLHKQVAVCMENNSPEHILRERMSVFFAFLKFDLFNYSGIEDNTNVSFPVSTVENKPMKTLADFFSVIPRDTCADIYDKQFSCAACTFDREASKGSIQLICASLDEVFKEYVKDSRKIDLEGVGRHALRALMQIPVLFKDSPRDYLAVESIKNQVRLFMQEWTTVAGKPSTAVPRRQLNQVLGFLISRFASVHGVFAKMLDHPGIFTKLMDSDQKLTVLDGVCSGAALLSGVEIRELSADKKLMLLRLVEEGITLSKTDRPEPFEWVLATYLTYVKVAASPDVSPSMDDFCKKLQKIIDRIPENHVKTHWRLTFILCFAGSVFGVSPKPSKLKVFTQHILPVVRQKNLHDAVLAWQYTVLYAVENNMFQLDKKNFLELFRNFFQPSDFRSYLHHKEFGNFLGLLVHRFPLHCLKDQLLRLDVNKYMLDFCGYNLGFSSGVFESDGKDICFRLLLSQFIDNNPEDKSQAVRSVINDSKTTSVCREAFLGAIEMFNGYLQGMRGRTFSEVEATVCRGIADYIDFEMLNLRIEIVPYISGDTLVTDDFLVDSLSQPLGFLRIFQADRDKPVFESPILCESEVSFKLSVFVRNFEAKMADFPVRRMEIAACPPMPTEAAEDRPTVQSVAHDEVVPHTEKKQKLKTRKATPEILPAQMHDVPSAMSSVNLHSPAALLLEAAFDACVRKGVKYREVKKELKTYLDDHGPQYNIRVQDGNGGRHKHLKVTWTENNTDHSVEVAVGHCLRSEVGFGVLKKMAKELVSAINHIAHRQA